MSMNDQKNTNSHPQTVGEALSYCSAALESSDVFFGHGTDNPWDEAVQLVLSVADLPLDADDGVLPHPVDEACVCTDGRVVASTHRGTYSLALPAGARVVCRPGVSL